MDSKSNGCTSHPTTTLKNRMLLASNMAGASSAADSEPLFILEPLPELGDVIGSYLDVNPILLLVGLGLNIFFLTRFPDPITKLWTFSAFNAAFHFYVTSSLFYSMIFTSVAIFAFTMVWAAIRWDDVKSALGIDNARIISAISFVISTYILVVLGSAIGMPAGPGVVICGLTTAYLWWNYYSLEPARA